MGDDEEDNAEDDLPTLIIPDTSFPTQVKEETVLGSSDGALSGGSSNVFVTENYSDDENSPPNIIKELEVPLRVSQRKRTRKA